MNNFGVVALLATYNEERFIRGCLDHLIQQGLDVYVIDNESTDRTPEIALEYLGNGVIGVESIPRDGVYRWRTILRRKEDLADSLDADWFVHLDADEIRLPPRAGVTLADAFADLDDQGYNAVGFQEFTFMPTIEEPDHDHPDFQRTMRWYYPYKSGMAHGLKAWKRPTGSSRQWFPKPRKRGNRAELAWSGGHRIRFRGMRVYQRPFPMRHYLFLSVPHAIEKYVERRFDAEELRSGWHQWRARLTEDSLRLPAQSELRAYGDDWSLDSANPRSEHYIAQWIEQADVARSG